MSWMDEGVVVHMRGEKLFAFIIGNLITEIVMMSHDEAALLAVQCVAYGEYGVATVAVGREVWGICSIA